MRSLRIFAGFAIGVLLSYAAQWLFFRLTGQPDHAVLFSKHYLQLMAVTGFVCSLATGLVTAYAGHSSFSAYCVAILIALVCFWTIVEAFRNPVPSVATTWVALFLMAPATALGGLLYSLRTRKI